MDQSSRFVVFQNGAESIAALACSTRVVEGGGLRRRGRNPRSIVGTLKALGEPETLHSIGDDDDTLAVVPLDGGKTKVALQLHVRLEHLH